MVEFLVVRVAFGPDVETPEIGLSGGTLTVSIHQPQPGTIVAGTVRSMPVPEGALGRIVTSRLVPAWDQILAQARQLSQ
jgi:hypothetical protein